MAPDLLARLAGAAVYDLGQTLSKDAPHHPNYPPFTLALQYRHGDWVTPCGMTFASALIVTTDHTGTHVDAIGHCSQEGRLPDGVNAYEVQRGARGLVEHGIETMPPFLCRGVLLDVAAHRGVACLSDDDLLGPPDLEEVERAQETPIGEGDAVLIRTGRGRYWDDPPRYFDPSRSDPGPGAAGVDWLFRRRIAITGSDTIAYEAITPDLAEFGKGHIQLLGGGVPIIENLNLEELSSAGIHEFLFVMSPLKIVGGTGSPVRPLAVAL